MIFIDLAIISATKLLLTSVAFSIDNLEVRGEIKPEQIISVNSLILCVDDFQNMD